MLQRLLLLAKAFVICSRQQAPIMGHCGVYCQLLEDEEAVCTRDGRQALERLRDQPLQLPQYNEQAKALHVQGKDHAEALLQVMSVLICVVCVALQISDFKSACKYHGVAATVIAVIASLSFAAVAAVRLQAGALARSSPHSHPANGTLITHSSSAAN